MIILPVYPRVFTNGLNVIIEHEDGKRDYWGKESSLVEALRVAEDLQLGLQLMEFVRISIDCVLKDIRESLLEVASVELVDEIIVEELWQRFKSAR